MHLMRWIHLISYDCCKACGNYISLIQGTYPCSNVVILIYGGERGPGYYSFIEVLADFAHTHTHTIIWHTLMNIGGGPAGVVITIPRVTENTAILCGTRTISPSGYGGISWKRTIIFSIRNVIDADERFNEVDDRNLRKCKYFFSHLDELMPGLVGHGS